MSARLNHNRRNPLPKDGSGSVYPVGWREPIPSGDLTTTRRPSRPKGMRKQGQLTFDFEDSSPQAPENGLPIGNHTSQFFANVYLDRLNQYVKRGLKCRHYLRYADDFVLFGRERKELKDWMEKIEIFVKEKLLLDLHPKKIGPVPVSNGIDFLGYIIHRDHILVRRRVVNNLKNKLDWFRDRLIRREKFWSVCLFGYRCPRRLKYGLL